MDSRNVLKNCSSLSDRIVSIILYRLIELLKKVMTTRVYLILVVGIAPTSLLYRPVMITKYRLPDLIYRTGPRISIATSTKG